MKKKRRKDPDARCRCKGRELKSKREKGGILNCPGVVWAKRKKPHGFVREPPNQRIDRGGVPKITEQLCKSKAKKGPPEDMGVFKKKYREQVPHPKEAESKGKPGDMGADTKSGCQNQGSLKQKVGGHESSRQMKKGGRAKSKLGGN